MKSEIWMEDLLTTNLWKLAESLKSIISFSVKQTSSFKQIRLMAVTVTA